MTTTPGRARSTNSCCGPGGAGQFHLRPARARTWCARSGRPAPWCSPRSPAGPKQRPPRTRAWMPSSCSTASAGGAQRRLPGRVAAPAAARSGRAVGTTAELVARGAVRRRPSAGSGRGVMDRAAAVTSVLAAGARGGPAGHRPPAHGRKRRPAAAQGRPGQPAFTETRLDRGLHRPAGPGPGQRVRPGPPRRPGGLPGRPPPHGTHPRRGGRRRGRRAPESLGGYGLAAGPDRIPSADVMDSSPRRGLVPPRALNRPGRPRPTSGSGPGAWHGRSPASSAGPSPSTSSRNSRTGSGSASAPPRRSRQARPISRNASPESRASPPSPDRRCSPRAVPAGGCRRAAGCSRPARPRRGPGRCAESWLSKAIRGRNPASRNRASVRDRMPYPGPRATNGSCRMSARPARRRSGQPVRGGAPRAAAAPGTGRPSRSSGWAPRRVPSGPGPPSPAASSARQLSRAPWLSSNSGLRMAAPERADQQRQRGLAERVLEGTAIRPRTTSDSCRTRSRPALELGQRGLDVGQECLGRRREPDTPAVPDQQFGAHDGAGPGHRPAHRRLRHTQQLGGLRDVLGAARARRAAAGAAAAARVACAPRPWLPAPHVSSHPFLHDFYANHALEA